MRFPPSRFRHTTLIACAVLVLVGAWALGSHLETSKQVKSPAASQPLAPTPAQAVQSAQPAAPLLEPSPPLLPKQPPIAVPMTEVPAAPAESSPPTLPPPSLPHAVNDLEMSSLRSRAFVIPVQGTTAPQLSDTFTQARTGGVPHDALDIMAPRGTPVLAVEAGSVAKLFLSKAGGITLYQFDQDRRYAYYYAHLDRYANGLTEGVSVSKGQVIGYVGSTGNASPAAPHLHFAIFRMDSEPQWWRGTPLNPYLVWRDAKP